MRESPGHGCQRTASVTGATLNVRISMRVVTNPCSKVVVRRRVLKVVANPGVLIFSSPCAACVVSIVLG